MNMNALFDKMTNFKIKFKTDESPTPIEIGNKDLIFVTWSDGKLREFIRVELNKDTDTVEVIIE